MNKKIYIKPYMEELQDVEMILLSASEQIGTEGDKDDNNEDIAGAHDGDFDFEDY